MPVLVAYASKHGATREIAERIAESLRSAGQPAELHPVHDTGELAEYDGFVVGSATYMGHWHKEATAFVNDHREVLAQRPVWLFSSGPLGTKATDVHGQDLRRASEPKEIADLLEMIHPRQHRVFFGVLDPSGLSFPERTLRKLPAARAIMPEGDFRDWDEIEGWAQDIAAEMTELLAPPQDASP